VARRQSRDHRGRVAVALLGFGFLIGSALSSQGRGVEHEGLMGRRTDVGGFDRPRDQSGL
jgi:hypothetical protein